RLVNTDNDVIGLDERVRALALFQLQPLGRISGDYRHYIHAFCYLNRHFRADWPALDPLDRADKFIPSAEFHVNSCCSLSFCLDRNRTLRRAAPGRPPSRTTGAAPAPPPPPPAPPPLPLKALSPRASARSPTA